MPARLKNLPQQYARLASEFNLYILNGFLFDAARYLDSVRNQLRSKRIACHYCTAFKHSQLPRTKKYEAKVRWFFTKVGNLLRAINLFTLNIMLWFVPRFIQNFFKKKMSQLLQLAKNGLHWAEQYRSQVAYYGILPFSLLALSASIWGVSIIPEVYIFLLASNWSGKILNFAANLIVRGEYSEEWYLAKNWFSILFWPQKSKDKAYRSHFFKLCLRGLAELALITTIGRYFQFIKYCSSAFLSWLGAYVIYKFAAEQGKTFLSAIESKAKQHRGRTSQTLNAAWLLTYHIYKMSSSTKSFKEYKRHHKENHYHHRRRSRSPFLIGRQV